LFNPPNSNSIAVHLNVIRTHCKALGGDIFCQDLWKLLSLWQNGEEKDGSIFRHKSILARKLQQSPPVAQALL
jgi:hypothetical protein